MCSTVRHRSKHYAADNMSVPSSSSRPMSCNASRTIAGTPALLLKRQVFKDVERNLQAHWLTLREQVRAFETIAP